ncbi:hypothetical protein IF2G_02449 [Cordyceps javanica]|nr:hypothetical protein IF2G_02449 [Cordyceps javanica]
MHAWVRCSGTGWLARGREEKGNAWVDASTFVDACVFCNLGLSRRRLSIPNKEILWKLPFRPQIRSTGACACVRVSDSGRHSHTVNNGAATAVAPLLVKRLGPCRTHVHRHGSWPLLGVKNGYRQMAWDRVHE